MRKKNLQARKHIDKTTQLRAYAALQGKRITQDGAFGPERRASGHRA